MRFWPMTASPMRAMSPCGSIGLRIHNTTRLQRSEENQLERPSSAHQIPSGFRLTQAAKTILSFKAPAVGVLPRYDGCQEWCRSETTGLDAVGRTGGFAPSRAAKEPLPRIFRPGRRAARADVK